MNALLPNETADEKRARYARNIQLGDAIQSLLQDERFILWKEMVDKKIEAAQNNLKEAPMATETGRRIAESNVIRWQAFNEVLDWQMLIDAASIARDQLKKMKGA